MASDLTSLELSLLAQLLTGGSWKKLLRVQGADLARAELRKLWKAKLEKAAPRIAQEMQREGWTWDSQGKPAHVEDEGLGRGFVLSRDALYRLIRATGVPTGAVRDGWRDQADVPTWALIQAEVHPNVTSLTELVTLTADALVEHTL